MKYLFTLIWAAISTGAFAQSISKFKLQIHYTGQFFVRSYDEYQRVPTNGANPSLLNGFRPYGKNEVKATIVVG